MVGGRAWDTTRYSHELAVCILLGCILVTPKYCVTKSHSGIPIYLIGVVTFHKRFIITKAL